MSVANPFKSLVPFGAKDWQTLFGRDADLDLVLNRIHSGKCTLLFAGSGVGKTSFLRAKLIPELESRNFICYHNRWGQRPPLEAIRESLIISMARHARVLDESASSTLNGDPGQFSIAEFYVQFCEDTALLVLDQFEELFQHFRDTAALDAFVQQIAILVSHSESDVRIVFAMREEFLGDLSIFDNLIPDLFNNYHRLKNFSTKQARDIIRLTAKSVDQECNRENLELLIEDLQIADVRQLADVSKAKSKDPVRRRPYVSAPFLQIVCHYWWEHEKPQDKKPFLEGYKSGKAQEALASYCDEKLNPLPRDRRKLASRCFEYLMTRQGAKIVYELENLAKHMSVTKEVLQAVLEPLSAPETRILRETQGPNNSRWFELYHDMYAPFLFAWKTRFDEGEKRRERRESWIIVSAAILALAVGGTWYSLHQGIGSIANADSGYSKALGAYDWITRFPLINKDAMMLWSQYWSKRGYSALGRGDRDEALLAFLHQLSIDSGKEPDIERQVQLLMDGAQRDLIATYYGPGYNNLRPLSLGVTPDGKGLFALSNRRIFQSWDVDSGKPSTAVQLDGPVRLLSPDGKYALTFSNRGSPESATVLSTVSGKQVYSTALYTHGISTTAFSFKAPLLAVCSGGDIGIYSSDGSLIGGAGRAGADCGNIAFSQDDRRLAAVDQQGHVIIWNLQLASDAKGKPSLLALQYRSWLVDNPQYPISERLGLIRFSRFLFDDSGRFLLIKQSDRHGVPGLAEIWNVETKKPLGQGFRAMGPVSSIWLDADQCVVSTSTGVLQRWTLPDIQPTRPVILNINGRGLWSALGAKGNSVFIEDKNGVIRQHRVESNGPDLQFFDSESSALIRDGSTVSDSAGGVVSSDGKYILSFINGQILLINRENKSTTKLYASKDVSVDAMEFSPNGDSYAFQTKGGWAIGSVSGGKPGLYDGDAVTFSPASRFVALAYRTTVTVLEKSGSGWSFRGLLDPGSTVNSVSIDDAGHVLAGLDNITAVTQMLRSKPFTYKHPAAVTLTAFVPDSEQFVTATVANDLYLWTRNEAKPLVGPFAHEGKILELVFAPDHRTLVVATSRALYVYNLDGQNSKLRFVRYLDGSWTGSYGFPDPSTLRMVLELTGRHSFIADVALELSKYPRYQRPANFAWKDVLSDWTHRLGAHFDKDGRFVPLYPPPSNLGSPGDAGTDSDSRDTVGSVIR